MPLQGRQQRAAALPVLAHESMDEGLTKLCAVQQCLCLPHLTTSILLDKDLMPQLSRFALRPASRCLQPGEEEAESVRTLGLIMLQLLTGRYTSDSGGFLTKAGLLGPLPVLPSTSCHYEQCCVI